MASFEWPYVCEVGHRTTVQIFADEKPMPHRCQYLLTTCEETECRDGGHPPYAHMARYCGKLATPEREVEVKRIKVDVSSLGLEIDGELVREVSPNLHFDLIAKGLQGPEMVERLRQYCEQGQAAEGCEHWRFQHMEGGGVKVMLSVDA